MTKSNITGLFKKGDIIKINKQYPFRNAFTKENQIPDEAELEVVFHNNVMLIVNIINSEKYGYVFDMQGGAMIPNILKAFTLVRQAEKESSDSCEHVNNSTTLKGGEA